MIRSAHVVTAVLLGALALACAAGCVSRREMMQERREPRNTVLKAEQIVGQQELTKDNPSWFGMWDSTDTQSIYVLRLAKDAVLDPRYHDRHDLFIVCLKGNAIVEVEKERTFLEPPAGVLVPRLHAYSILPHKTEEDFAALLVFSPYYDADAKNRDERLVTE